MITPQQGYKIDPTNPNQVIRGSDLSPVPALNITPPQPTSPVDVKNIPITTPPTPPVPAPTTSPFITEIENLTSKLLGGEAEKEKRITEKTADFSTALNELNTQIKMHQANALARQEEALKSGATLRYSTGLAGQVSRTDAIEAMKLSALAQGMQGNILLATKQAESAVEAEFSQTKKDIETQRQNILNNYDTFTEAEKKRADASLLRLDKEDAFVGRKKVDREQAYKTAVEAAKNGLTDTSLLTQIQNSTPEKALELAAPFMKEKEKLTFQTFERMGADGVIHNIRQVLDSQGKVISETDLGTKEKATDILNREAEIIAYAQQYAADGKIPPGMPKELLAQVSEKAKALPKQKGQVLDGSTGLAPAGETTLTNAMAGASSAIELAKQLKELDKERIKGLIPALGGKIIGTSAQQRYVDLKSQIVDLLARARTGAVLTEAEEKFYGGLLPGRIGQVGFGLFGVNTQDRIDNFINNLSSDLQNKAASKGWVINGLSKINLGGKEYTVGQEIEINGIKGRILPDGSIATQ